MFIFESIHKFPIESLLTKLDFKIFQFKIEDIIWVGRKVKLFYFIIVVLIFIYLFFWLSIFTVEDSFLIPLFLDFLNLGDQFLHVFGFLDITDIVIVILVANVRGVEICKIER